MLRLLMLALIATLLAGCAKLPAVNAKLIRYESSYPIGGSSIEVTDVEVTDTEVKAGSYKRTTKMWGVSQSITVEGYSRPRTAGDKPTLATP